MLKLEVVFKKKKSVNIDAQQLAADTGHRQSSSCTAAEATESSTITGALGVLGSARRLRWGKGKGEEVMERWNLECLWEW